MPLGTEAFRHCAGAKRNAPVKNEWTDQRTQLAAIQGSPLLGPCRYISGTFGTFGLFTFSRIRWTSLASALPPVSLRMPDLKPDRADAAAGLIMFSSEGNADDAPLTD